MLTESRGTGDGAGGVSPPQLQASLLKAVPRALFLFLIVLTLIALLPWNPQGPFDARDWSVIEGVHLDYPWSGVLMEPLLAPAHALMGAPDFRIALIATAVWLMALALIAGLVTGRGVRQRVGRGLAWGAIAFGSAMLYLVFIALVHLPGWRLVVDDPERYVADLQTHTFGSHDGLVTAEQNLAWHEAHGYNLIAITEHNDPRGSFVMQAVAEARDGAPVVIPGGEVSDEADRFLLGVGLDPAAGLLPWKGNQKEYARKFIDHVHTQGGAVIALAWLLKPEDVAQLAALGLDAIELVNTGHPDVPDTVRAAMLDVAAQRPLVLLASTDWHGWSGFTRTWTLIDLSDAATESRVQVAHAVVGKLRAREADAFTPVAAGRMGPPGLWRALFAPWVEAVRYAAELSPARVAAWWVWGVVIAVAASALRRRGWHSTMTLAALTTGGVGIALGWRAWALLAYREEGVAHAYAVEMGRPALGMAVAALVLAALLLFSARRRSASR